VRRDRPVARPGPRRRFFTTEGQINAVENVSFTVEAGSVLGVVGESGSGKSVTGLSLIDLVESPGQITSGEIWYNNADLADRIGEEDPEAVDGDFVDLRRLSEAERRSLRGSAFSMIFQDPMSSFNPSITVGEQIAEAAEVQRRASANPRSTRSDAGVRAGQMFLDGVLPNRARTPPRRAGTARSSCSNASAFPTRPSAPKNTRTSSPVGCSSAR